MRTRILLADDHAILRSGVKLLLNTALKDVEFGETGTCSETRELAVSHPWDLILLDLSMPGRGGLDVLKEIHVWCPSIPVLILSMHDNPQFALRAFRNGAVGYLTKASAPKELIQAVRRVLDGGHYITPELSELLVTELGKTPTDLLYQRLSDREFEILRMIAAGKTVKQIAVELCLSINTISTYRTRILDKMNMQTNAQLMRYAFANKLIE